MLRDATMRLIEMNVIFHQYSIYIYKNSKDLLGKQ